MNQDIATIGAPPQGGVVRTSIPGPVTVFVCANCARPGQAPTSAGRPRPAIPDFGWPWPVQEILVACTGRLQPEHVLKAFESGSDVVAMVACRGGQLPLCGGQQALRAPGGLPALHPQCDRAGRRASDALPSAGHGGGRHGAGRRKARAGVRLRRRWTPRQPPSATRSSRPLRHLPPNPLHQARAAGHAEEICQEVDISYDDNEE